MSTNTIPIFNFTVLLIGMLFFVYIHSANAEDSVIKIAFSKNKEFCKSLVKSNSLILPKTKLNILFKDKSHSYFLVDIDNDGVLENVIRESNRIRGENNDTYFIYEGKISEAQPKDIFWKLIRSKSTYNLPNKWAEYGQKYRLNIPGHTVPLEINLKSTIVELFQINGETYFYLVPKDNDMERNLLFSAIIKPEANGYVTDMCYFQLRASWQQ